MTAASGGNELSSSIAIPVIVALVVGVAFVVTFSLSHSGNKGEEGKEGDSSGSWARVAIKDFDYETIKVGQPIPSFTVEVTSHGTRFCKKPDVYIGKVSAASSSSPAGITPMGVTYDFKIPVNGHLVADCTLDQGGNYTTIWVANTTTTATASSSITSYSNNNNNTPIVLREAGTYDIVADAQLRHPSTKRFDVEG